MGGWISWLSSGEPVDMEGETAQQIKQLIANNDVVIFSKTYCPYCTMAKKVFDGINVKYTTVELNEHKDGSAMQAILGEMTGAKTVPRVFVKGQCVGGGTDVQALNDAGKLKPLLC